MRKKRGDPYLHRHQYGRYRPVPILSVIEADVGMKWQGRQKWCAWTMPQAGRLGRSLSLLAQTWRAEKPVRRSYFNGWMKILGKETA